MPADNSRIFDQLRSSEDADFIEIWRQCSPFTMTSVERGLALFRATRYLVERRIPGIFVECGLWRGGSVMIAMQTLLRMNAPTRRFVLFDTFTGMTEPGKYDEDYQGRHAATLMSGDEDDEQTQLVIARADQQQVTANIAATGYDMDAVRFIVGDVRVTVPRASLPPIGLLRLDTDFYDSTYSELMYLYPRLVQNGVLIVDDYGHWQGARKAVDDYFSGGGPAPNPRPPSPFLHRIDYTGRMAIRTDESSGALPEELQNDARQRRRPLVSSSGKPVLPDEQRTDYIPPELEDPQLLNKFPSLVLGDLRRNKWPYLRLDAPHRWRIDNRSRDKHVGVLSVEEATILFNLAKPFAGLRGLAIGCHYAWSTAHLLAAGLNLDVVDPRFSRSDQLSDVQRSLDSIATQGSYHLWAAYSPSIIPALHARRGEPWSFVFIDGDHEGDAPRLDAEAVQRFCHHTAMIVFHDLISPHVLAGLVFLAGEGWQTRIYNTMQVMGVAWRGNCTPLEHVPDPQMPPLPDYVAIPQ